ncbi:unnamed protein product [Porites lobata]|uniref:Alcohol dehydrogenase-like C-terminal domain-containing protein n=1 Tax=Porites lobata TaxID=104759 RepID=A0ABN8NV38_9CNID|nr:unnamed protein product [Porites lobata]
MEDKILRTINTICLNFSHFPPRPQSNVVVCAPLYTLPCPKSVSSSQHCLEGVGEGQSRHPSESINNPHYLNASFVTKKEMTYSTSTPLFVCLFIQIPQDFPLDKACLLGCGVPTGYGAAVNTAQLRSDHFCSFFWVKPGSSVAVWGLGGVGLSAVMGCKAAGAARIIGIDIKSDKFPLAKELGASECMNPNDYDKPIQQVLTEITQGGLDFTIECIGKVETMRAAFEASHVGWGTTVIVGVAQEQLSVNPDHLLTGKNIIGSIFGGCVAHEIIPKLSEEYMAGKMNLDKLISHTMRLEKINEAFDLMHAGKRFVSSRCILLLK